MALETPNRLAASARFFYALAGALPPPNDDAILTLTAAEGIASLQVPPAEGVFSGTIADGFYMELMHPVEPGNATWMMCGAPTHPIPNDDICGLTPLPVLITDGTTPTIVEWADTLGNFLCLLPELDGDYGWWGVGIWEHPVVPNADTPFPIRVVV